MNKSRIYIAAGLISVAAILISASLIYARQKTTKEKLQDCEDAWVKCSGDCALLANREVLESCYRKCDARWRICREDAKARIQTGTTRPPDAKVQPGRVESTPKPTPRDKAPTGPGLKENSSTPTPRNKSQSVHVLEKGNLSPTPTPSPKKKISKGRPQI